LEGKSKTLAETVANLGDPAVLQNQDPRALDAPLKRSEEILSSLDASSSTAKQVLESYRRILREEQLNQVAPDSVKRVGKDIVEPMENIVEGRALEGVEPGDFPDTQKALEALRAPLDDVNRPLAERVADARKAGADAQAQLGALIRKLRAVLDIMKGISGKTELTLQLIAIDREVMVQQAIAHRYKEKAENSLFDDK
jgi:hypothetical protein